MSEMQDTGTVTVDLVGCARCRGEGHPGLVFRPLAFPVAIPGGPVMTHWASCPTNGEPILRGMVEAVPK